MKGLTGATGLPGHKGPKGQLSCRWDVISTQRWHGAKITSLLSQNDVATSFWRNNDVIIASCVRWGGNDTDGCIACIYPWAMTRGQTCTAIYETQVSWPDPTQLAHTDIRIALKQQRLKKHNTPYRLRHHKGTAWVHTGIINVLHFVYKGPCAALTVPTLEPYAILCSQDIWYTIISFNLGRAPFGACTAPS